MPIVVTLDKVLADRAMTLTELSARVGLTLANVSVLKSGRARAIRFSTLEAICRVLRCQPGDLLSYTEGDTEADLRNPSYQLACDDGKIDREGQAPT